MRKLIAFMFLISLFGVSTADMFKPSHMCSKPYKPYEFSSKYERDSFIDEVERYKNCINDFVDEQKQAVDNHNEAANEAIEEFNSFVRWELQ